MLHNRERCLEVVPLKDYFNVIVDKNYYNYIINVGGLI